MPASRHPLAENCLNLVWLRVPNTTAFSTIAEQIESAPYYTNPSVKCETASSGIANFLDAYRDLLWGVRYLLVPAALVSLATRDRQRHQHQRPSAADGAGRDESARLPAAANPDVWSSANRSCSASTAGFISSAGTWYVINNVFGGVPFPIAFFPKFMIADDGAVVGTDWSAASPHSPAAFFPLVRRVW